jgi:hypothetical protein
MKSTDLRIGNWIHDPIYKRDARVFRLTSGVHYPITYTYGSVYEYAPPAGDSLEGIPLTEEWLKNLGALQAYGGGKMWYELPVNGWLSVYRLEGVLSIFAGKEELGEVQYVHQLQNVFHSLTGTELEIKSN